jgi:acetyl esterase/lipase
VEDKCFLYVVARCIITKKVKKGVMYMLYKEFKISEEGSLDYAKLTVYIQEYSESIAIEKRPLILICPGGGYAYTSDREAEPIALTFMAAGFHTAILRYSCAPARYPVALTEVSRCFKIIRDNASDWHVDSDKIMIMGFSAGGHLAANYCCEWHDSDFAGKYVDENVENLRPNGLILGYPVITSGEYAHRGSFENLLGEREKELSEKVSLEKQVNEYVPKTFIWATFTDGSVPVENTLLFAKALKEKNINTEMHIFPVGGHGLALANELTLTNQKTENVKECQIWTDLAITWTKNL